MLTPMPDYGISFSDTNDHAITRIDINNLSAQDHAQKFLLSQVEDSNYNHNLTAAQLWAIKKDSTYHLLSAHPDVYDLLEQPFDATHYTGIIVHTTGWAAPISDNGEVDGPPSKHAERRRIGIASCVMNDSIGSALSFSDEQELVLDSGSATGSLANALSECWQNNVQLANTVNTLLLELKDK
jgi:hypothetical protein